MSVWDKKPKPTGSVGNLVAEQEEQISRFEETHRRFKYERDEDFFVCLVFHSQEQRAAFLAALQLPDGKFTDGPKLAGRLGITLPAAPNVTPPRVSAKWKALT